MKEKLLYVLCSCDSKERVIIYQYCICNSRKQFYYWMICALNAKNNFCVSFFVVIFFIDEKGRDKSNDFEQFYGDFWLNPSGNTEADLQENVE